MRNRTSTRSLSLPALGAAPAWPSGLALGVITVLFIVLGHDGRRIGQLLVLTLPLFALLWLPLASTSARRFRSLGIWLWVMIFVLDGVARGYLQDSYQASPDGTLVLSAAANTNLRESGEFLQMHWRAMLLWSSALLVASALAWIMCFRLGARVPNTNRSSRALKLSLALLLILVILAYSSKPWRRLHPVAFWSHWAESVSDLREDWSNHESVRAQMLRNADALAPVVTRSTPATVMLVLGESVNRDNMSLYGYARNTTPQLLALKKSEASRMLVIQNAWSVEASTQPSLEGMFHLGGQQTDPAQQQHLLALVRAAGYKTWWVSNHDDLAVEQQHARLANVVQLVNRTPGRSSVSLDGELLDEVRTALADPHERKLIVVHLLGAHPHYRLRFPEDHNPFDDHADAVENQLIAQGRPAWLRNFRTEYDAAVLYHDSVIASLLRMTQEQQQRQTQAAGATPDKPHYSAFMYLSDHGQEVGHTINHAGHSPATAAGYRIPAVLWRSEAWPIPSKSLSQRPFRADWLAWTFADLLHLQWSGQLHERNLLAANYRWQRPPMPLAIPSFSDPH